MEKALGLTVTCILVVFCALLILWMVYSFMGAVSTGKIKIFQRPSYWHHGSGKDEPAPVKPAAQGQRPAVVTGETAAVIALALHMYEAENMHDAESYVLTTTNAPSAWSAKERNFRKRPIK